MVCHQSSLMGGNLYLQTAWTDGIFRRQLFWKTTNNVSPFSLTFYSFYSFYSIQLDGFVWSWSEPPTDWIMHSAKLFSLVLEIIFLMAYKILGFGVLLINWQHIFEFVICLLPNSGSTVIMKYNRWCGGYIYGHIDRSQGQQLMRGVKVFYFVESNTIINTWKTFLASKIILFEAWPFHLLIVIWLKTIKLALFLLSLWLLLASTGTLLCSSFSTAGQGSPELQNVTDMIFECMIIEEAQVIGELF